MAEILSQSEIDELLAALASGKDTSQEEPPEPEDGQHIQVYDFRDASKFSKEQIRMLNFIFDSYAGRLSTLFSGLLRAACEVEVVSVEELKAFREYNNSLPTPAFLTIFDMPPLAGSCLMELSPAISFEIISRLFGGKGMAGEDAPNKPFTDIEIAILSRVVQQMMEIMDESWERVTEVHASMDRIETSAQFAQIVAVTEPVALITLNVTVGETSDILNFCIPHLAIQPISKLLATSAWYNEGGSQGGEEEKSLEELAPRINNTILTLSARFNATSVTVEDIIHLQEGDVLQLNHMVKDPITVMVEHIPKFHGVVGKQGKRAAVRITDIIKEETDDG